MEIAIKPVTLAVDVDTALTLTECTTDIDVIVKQVNLAVRDNFRKIERSSDPYIIDKVRFASY